MVNLWLFRRAFHRSKTTFTKPLTIFSKFFSPSLEISHISWDSCMSQVRWVRDSSERCGAPTAMQAGWPVFFNEKRPILEIIFPRFFPNFWTKYEGEGEGNPKFFGVLLQFYYQIFFRFSQVRYKKFQKLLVCSVYICVHVGSQETEKTGAEWKIL